MIGIIRHLEYDIHLFLVNVIFDVYIVITITGTIPLLVDSYYYHRDDTSAGGLLVPEDIIHPVVSVTITGTIPLLVDS